ncbi:MAG: hypothetical protein KBA30_09505 [Clostridia bacterium]|nr:hypothetical protein [Clostridia bacterium]
MLALFRRWDFVYYSLLGNLLTNPALNLLLLLAVRMAGAAAYWPALAVLEAGAVTVEAVVLRMLCGFSPCRALIVSLMLNVLSFGAGRLFGPW